jgi:hypothetical protein
MRFGSESSLELQVHPVSVFVHFDVFFPRYYDFTEHDVAADCAPVLRGPRVHGAVGLRRGMRHRQADRCRGCARAGGPRPRALPVVAASYSLMAPRLALLREAGALLDRADCAVRTGGRTEQNMVGRRRCRDQGVGLSSSDSNKMVPVVLSRMMNKKG